MDYEKLIQEIKEKIDEGFVKVNGKIDHPSFLERYLVASTIKAVDLSNAIIFLCKKNFIVESLIILRSLIEHSINMRWIMNENTDKRLKEYLSDLEKIEFGNLWTNHNLKKRMEDVGFKDEEYYNYIVKITYSYSHVNASTLDWEKVINDDQFKILEKFSSPQPVYAVMAQMLGHVIKSLDLHFKGLFNYAEDIWRKISVDKGSMKKRLEEMIKQFEKNE